MIARLILGVCEITRWLSSHISLERIQPDGVYSLAMIYIRCIGVFSGLHFAFTGSISSREDPSEVYSEGPLPCLTAGGMRLLLQAADKALPSGRQAHKLERASKSQAHLSPVTTICMPWGP